MQVSAALSLIGENARAERRRNEKSQWFQGLVATPETNQGSQIMDKDRIKGSVKQAKGTVKENLGKLSGDKSLEVEGKIQRAEGSVQKAVGKAKDSLRKI